MATTLVLNAVSLSDGSRDSARKKKKRKQRSKENHQSQNYRQWKSESQQQLYSSKLVQAIGQIRISSPSRRGRAVREAADRVLAMAAKGRTKWSRAILTNRLKLNFRKHKRQKAPSAGNNWLKKARVRVRLLKGKSLPAVQRKVGVLGRLIPGCQKEPLPVILEEVTDYIAALEMQVRAMSALAGSLSAETPGDRLFPA